jgi:TolB-like protein/class 3 adenylate cyclase/Flp pilus assembly protein TadD
MAAALHLTLLGGFDARRPDGVPLPIAGKKNQALLAYLALCRGQPQTREKIVGLLWSDRDDEHARNSLRQALVAMRRDLDGGSSALVIAGDRLALDPAAIDVDALSVEHLVSSRRADDLRSAVRLYRGDLLDGLAIADQAFEEWLAGERTRLRELVIAAILRGLPDLAGDEAVALAQRALALDPLREASHRALMRALAGHGQADLALRQYQTCRDVLRRELGVEPDAETASLRDEIAGDTRGAPPAAPAPQGITRRLAAILAADVAGYSRLMGADEEGTLKTLNLFRGIITRLIEAHQGRVVGTAGDNVLAEFASAVLAVRSAVAVQRALDRHNADLDEARRMKFRIGINVGDVIVQGADLLGDGVNVAARLEQMAEPGGIVVSGTVWEQIQGKVEFPCSYLGEQTAKNIARPLRTYRVDWEQPDMRVVGSGGTPEAPALPNKPSIVVLPFANVGGDPEQEYFADGISEDIITALSRLRWLFVIARHTSFAYKGKETDVRQVARELGVRYVMEGSVRKAGDRVRITAQLIDAETAAQLWGERYDRDLANTFAVQDAITESVVGAIEPELQQVERQRAARKRPENMDAWDHYMRGMWRNYQFNAEDSLRAERLMRRAIELDPTLAPGHIGLARVLVIRIWWGWSEDPRADGQAAYAAARRAIELDDRDPYAHYVLTWPSLLRREHESALAAAQKAIDLMPNFVGAYHALGAIRLFLGRFDQVSDPIQRAMRLSPHDPLTMFYYYLLALAQYHQGHYEEATKLARTGIGVRPYHLLYRTLAACYGQLGHSEDARAALAELRRLMPKDAERLWEITHTYVDPAHRAHFIDGLRKAELLEEAATPTKPSIAVLPFANLSGDPAQEYFSDGITEDIIAGLARLHWLFVIARNSSFTFKGKVADVKEIGKSLGVRYLLEGSVRKAGDRVRITCQLIDAATGVHLWTDRFEGTLSDVFDLQDRITSSVIGAIEPRLRHAEIERACRKPTDNIDAYDLFLRALALHNTTTFEDSREALRLLGRAIELDPNYAAAYGLAAYCHMRQRQRGWVASTTTEGSRLARLAAQKGQDDPEALWMAGVSLAILTGESEDALALIERSLRLNPNSAGAWMASGMTRAYAGDSATAIPHFERSIQLNPLDPLVYITWFGIAFAHFAAERYDEASTWLDRSLRALPSYLPALRVKTAICALQGRADECRKWVERLLVIAPDTTLSHLRMHYEPSIRNPACRDTLLDGLRKAGLPE